MRKYRRWFRKLRCDVPGNGPGVSALHGFASHPAVCAAIHYSEHGSARRGNGGPDR